MAKLDKVALRYSRAVFDFIKDPKEVAEATEELKALAKIIQGHSELSMVLTSSVFTTEQREGILKDLGAKMKLSKTTLRILTIVSSQGRMGLLGSIADQLNLIALEAAGSVAIVVQAASDLEKDEKKKIEKRFEKLLGKTVQASYEVDPALIGGIKVTAHGRTYDGSLAGWLSTFEEQLVGGSI
jgi:F-type H+-transporting ATPase subunit delta